MLQNVNRQQLKVLKAEFKKPKNQISKWLTQLKNRYLVKSFLWFYCKCSRGGHRQWMTRIRISMVKGHSGIVRNLVFSITDSIVGKQL
jgi:hypothetical protein